MSLFDGTRSLIDLKTDHVPDQASESITREGAPQSENNSAPVQPILPQPPPAPPNPPNPHGGTRGTTPLWKKVVEVGAVIIAFGLLIVNIFQANSAQSAADAAKSAAGTARDAMQREQRAWLTISNSQAHWVIGSPLQVSPTITNTGKTPARHVRGTFAASFLEPYKIPEFIYAPGPGRFYVGFYSDILFPSVPVTTVIPFGRRPEDGGGLPSIALATRTMLDQFSHGDRFFVAHGRLTYDDIFNVHHWYNFCFVGSPPSVMLVRSTPEVPPLFASCNQRNSVDHNH